MSKEPCFHCLLDSSPDHVVEIGGQLRYFCCNGCQAIASAICAGGLASYYEFRELTNPLPETALVDPAVQQYDVYDSASVQTNFVRVDDNGISQVSISIDGIHCAACVWLIEKHLGRITGINRVSVNASNHQGLIEFDSALVKLSKVFETFAEIGFKISPHTGKAMQADWQNRQKTSLLRLGVAGLGMMQAGMATIALHAGDIQGIGSEWQSLLRWTALILTTPVLLYSGYPFFQSALRSLKARHLTMDVPVSIALGLAYAASALATITASGQVYFDSVAMFIFFLLLGRFLEQRMRYRNFLLSSGMREVIPFTALRLSPKDQRQRVPVASLELGDRIWVAAGDTFPVDGIVREGMSSADESLLTGEALPLAKGVNSCVVAGSQNLESALVVEVIAAGNETQFAAIERLVEQAGLDKPNQVAVADSIAGYFVAAVLLVAVSVAAYWLYHEPAKALWVTLAVLVVTCPCALSLGTPAALTAGLSALRNSGVLVTSGSALEKLASITDVVFDKTGTLTQGEFRIAKVLQVDMAQSESDLLTIAAALQEVSSHPIARAFHLANSTAEVTEKKSYPSLGVEGWFDGDLYRLGKPEFCMPDCPPLYPEDGLWLALTKNKHVLVAWMKLEDKLRSNAGQVVKQLKMSGYKVHLLTGDRAVNANSITTECDFDMVVTDQTPGDKLSFVANLQDQGRRVLMVGDGINDLPVLSAANVSIAMGHASQLTRMRADLILIANELLQIPNAIALAIRSKRIIKQNLLWAIIYNVVALPAAAAGLVPPWLAAIGMSLSSLIVVLNALRLTRASQ